MPAGLELTWAYKNRTPTVRLELATSSLGHTRIEQGYLYNDYMPSEQRGRFNGIAASRALTTVLDPATEDIEKEATTQYRISLMPMRLLFLAIGL
ncbi:hypothetical protein GW17_00032224 [Ensete ventricosum]|nr:hypothetical protein GW17_00032224 [Ensete ventricosum]